MKIYISHAGDYDYEAELYAPIKRTEAYKNHEFFLPHESHNIDTTAREVLKDTDLLVAEVSRASTGQGIELGLAASANVPIVCLYRQGAVPSGSLRFITQSVEPYTDEQDFLSKLQAAIDATKP